MTIDLTNVVIVFIGVLTSIISAYAIPYIKSKTTEKQQSIIFALARTAVYAAQQLYESSQSMEKRGYACSCMKNMLARYGITLTADEISTYIEGALKDIKTSIESGNW